MRARKLVGMPAQRKSTKPGDSPLNSGCSLRLSFLTLLPLSTAPVPRNVSGNPQGSQGLCDTHIFHSLLLSFTIKVHRFFLFSFAEYPAASGLCGRDGYVAGVSYCGERYTDCFQGGIMRYRIAIHQSEEGFSVSVPGLPGCWSQGATDVEAVENIKDAIREYLAVVEEQLRGEEIREIEVAV